MGANLAANYVQAVAMVLFVIGFANLLCFNNGRFAFLVDAAGAFAVAFHCSAARAIRLFADKGPFAPIVTESTADIGNGIGCGAAVALANGCSCSVLGAGRCLIGSVISEPMSESAANVGNVLELCSAAIGAEAVLGSVLGAGGVAV